MIVHPSLLSVAEMNTITKNTLFSLTIPSTVHDTEKSGQKFKHLQEAQRNTALWSALINLLNSLFQQPRPIFIGIAPLIVDWAFLYQLQSRKFRHRLDHRLI